MVLAIIVLSTNTVTLNIFNKILIEIYAFKNIKVKIQILDILFHTFLLIRDFPDHATFREKGAKLACADKLGVFLSLSLCKKANFDYLSFIKEKSLQKT